MGVNPVYQNFVVLTMHGFSNANYFLTIAFISVVSSMSFWWRDVISEGKMFFKSTILSPPNPPLSPFGRLGGGGHVVMQIVSST